MDSTLIIIGGLLLGCLLALSWFAGSDAPYVPTKNSRIKKILKLAGLKKGAEFWELGSGDGRVVLEAAKLGATSYGVEQSWIRIFWSRYQTKKQALPTAHFIHGDIFSVIRLPRPFGARNDGFWNANFVFIFLLPKGVGKLEPILKKNLKKGTKIITQTFHFKNWKPVKKILITDQIPNTLLGTGKYEGDFRIYQV